MASREEENTATHNEENSLEPRGDFLKNKQANDESSGTDSKLLEDNCCTKLHYFLQINRSFLPVKLLYAAFYGGLGCVLPYLAVFLKQSGLSPQQIGLISGIRPVIGFLSGPIWGILGDKYNIRKRLLLFSITAWLAFNVGLYHIPAPDRLHTCPTATHRSGAVTIQEIGWLKKHSVDKRQKINNNTQTTNISQFSPNEVNILKENIWWVYSPDGLHVVFIISFVIIVGGEFVQAPGLALADVGALHTLGPKGLHQFGPQRAWGSVGWAISSFAAGGLVSASRKVEYICDVELYFSDYRRLTYVFIVFMVLAFVSATQLKFKESKDPEKIELTATLKPDESETETVEKAEHNSLAVFKIFFNVHYGSWLATCFYVGVCNGVIWGFLFWHLENLGADQLLMGVDSVVLCVAEFIACFLVSKIIRSIGHMGIMYAGLVCYIVRFINYAVITNPWWVLPAEILNGISFSCVWVSMTSYTTISVPEESLATVQGLLHGLYFGLGNGLGHLLGGLLIGYFGAVVTFFSSAVATSVVLLMFIVAQKCSKEPDQIHYDHQEEDANMDSNEK